VVDVVEQSFDVELEDPVVFPAPLARNADSIVRRFSRPIAIGVCQKYWVQVRLNELFDNHLGHAIRYGGHA
jgi:hypothetical protein